ncbi:META domain-containing protein [Methanosarcina sp.]|uniref:META domain-containing protein n=1 Tax=Methanosarcina sp. TaxID=2213 RepID=UPI003C77F6E2
MKLRIKIKNKPLDLISLFFTVIIIIMMSFSQGCAEQGDTSPEPAATPANSGVISADNLTNVEWQWTGFQQSDEPENKTVVPDPENYTLAFFPDGRYYIKADCNGGSGNYILEENNLTLDPPVMTLIACGPGSMDSEYLSLLTSVKSAGFENEQLILYSENTGQRMFFTNGGLVEQKI